MNQNDHLEDGPNTSGTAFLLWLSCLFGFCGIHRFYLGKPVSGVLYLLTFGLLGIGQFVDLFLLKGMVRQENARARMLMQGPIVRQLPPPPPPPKIDPAELMRIQLLDAARRNGSVLSVSQGVLATGKTFGQVEKALDEMAISGFVGIDNDPNSGAVIYTFDELSAVGVPA